MRSSSQCSESGSDSLFLNIERFIRVSRTASRSVVELPASGAVKDSSLCIALPSVCTSSAIFGVSRRSVGRRVSALEHGRVNMFIALRKVGFCLNFFVRLRKGIFPQPRFCLSCSIWGLFFLDQQFFSASFWGFCNYKTRSLCAIGILLLSLLSRSLLTHVFSHADLT